MTVDAAEPQCDPGDALKHLVLRWRRLTYYLTAVLVRSRVLDVDTLRTDYVRTPGQGLSQRSSSDKHARRNALIPVITPQPLFVGRSAGVITESFNIRNRRGASARAAARHPRVTGSRSSSPACSSSEPLCDVLYALVTRDPPAVSASARRPRRFPSPGAAPREHGIGCTGRPALPQDPMSMLGLLIVAFFSPWPSSRRFSPTRPSATRT